MNGTHLDWPGYWRVYDWRWEPEFFWTPFEPEICQYVVVLMQRPMTSGTWVPACLCNFGYEQHVLDTAPKPRDEWRHVQRWEPMSESDAAACSLSIHDRPHQQLRERSNNGRVVWCAEGESTGTECEMCGGLKPRRRRYCAACEAQVRADWEESWRAGERTWTRDQLERWCAGEDCEGLSVEQEAVA